MDGDGVADDDGVVGHQDFLDQQANDALAFLDIKRLGIRAQPCQEGSQGLRQAQGGGALGRLVGDRAQFRLDPLGAAAQVGQASAQLLERQQVLLVGGYQTLHRLVQA